MIFSQILTAETKNIRSLLALARYDLQRRGTTLLFSKNVKDHHVYKENRDELDFVNSRSGLFLNSSRA